MAAIKNKVTAPVSNQIKLEDLRMSEEFQEFWRSVLAGMRIYNMNEAMLMHIHRARKRAGTIEQINATAALDMHRVEGALEIWELLLSLTDLEKTSGSDNVDYEGETI